MPLTFVYVVVGKTGVIGIFTNEAVAMAFAQENGRKGRHYTVETHVLDSKPVTTHDAQLDITRDA